MSHIDTLKVYKEYFKSEYARFKIIGMAIFFVKCLPILERIFK